MTVSSIYYILAGWVFSSSDPALSIRLIYIAFTEIYEGKIATSNQIEYIERNR